MAKRRGRARSAVLNRNRARVAGTGGLLDGGPVSAVPRVLVQTVNGVEIVAASVLQLARDVLLSTVSGAASIGAEALAATTAGARGVVSATSRMVGDIAGTAQRSFQDTLYNARHARAGYPGRSLRRPPARVGDSVGEAAEGPVESTKGPSRRRLGRQRPAARTASPRAAA
jgi:hypothetical protein